MSNIARIIKKILALEPLTSAEKQEYIRYSITTHDSGGKMADFMSISTSCIDCDRCSARSKNKKNVCAKCYARRELLRKKTLREKMHVNTVFYTCYTINPVDVPLINCSVFRFESFGEIQNTKQFINYNTIAKVNKHCYFVIWSKNCDIIASALETVKQAKNFDVIASATEINPDHPENLFNLYPFIKKVFAVVTDEYAKAHKIKITCIGCCIECMRCYTKANRQKVIYELLR